MPVARQQRGDFYYWRIIATGASFTLFGVGGMILGFIIFPLLGLTSRDERQAVQRCRRWVALSFRAFVGFMKNTGVLTWEVEGAQELEQPGILVVANHPTLIDIVFIIAMIPNASCIVKPSLYRNIFTRGPVSRAAYVASDEPESLIEDCVKTLETGASLVIFPEGTRSVQGMPLKFRRGAAHVQRRSGCPVVLVRISSNPPTLAKHEKWYQIPPTRPHFRLVVEKDRAAAGTVPQGSAAPDSRTITRRWRDYFAGEVMA